MLQMGFPDRWVLWFRGILESVRSAVLVNGSLTFEFNCEKGLRQGDPISPFLFLIVMEALSWVLKKAKSIGELSGVQLSEKEQDITHLFYADDTLILGEWSRENLEKTARILRVFYLCSGMRINLHKSNLFGVGTTDTEVENSWRVGMQKRYFSF
ncbi:putative mitochondrial protein AtMg01250 [Bidens hawaiensis]|uniref:putative mitochondrial protein AtMg01250 n=1 Tax=Bidens hawaiensis TaxID=980011 RepID=UPI004049FA0B